MLIRKEALTEKQMAEVLSYSGGHLPVLFDIETTGLSWRTSHIYLLGMICREQGNWVLVQWFLDRPTEEKQMLEAFSSYTEALRKEGHDLLIHYNGDTFDLPYLAHKYGFYKMADPFQDWNGLDIYRRIRPFQKLLGLSSLRQKNVEAYLGIGREDEKSGGELIETYRSYLGSRDESLKDLLFLHNHDDVLCMPEIIRILSFCELFCGNFRVRDPFSAAGRVNRPADTADIYLVPAHPFPSSCSIRGPFASLDLRKDAETCRLQVPLRKGVMKHFFRDYRNYYFLPMEDQAIHKSVAAFVDNDHKVKASPETCYQKSEGVFVPAPAKPAGDLPVPLYRDEPKSKTVFLKTEDLEKGGPDVLRAYVCILLASLLKPSGK